MNLCLKNKIRRCRPLLGTYVEVAVEHDDSGQAQAAVNAAFAAVERVHQLMSFYDPESEISRLNCLAAQQDVVVSVETYHVLQRAKELYERTQGIFDITVAAELLERGVLPKPAFFKKQKDYYGRTKDIVLLPDRSVRFLQPLQIDLGGIAKGFAVDQAIEVLKQNGMDNGCVNAGGDMRCFGDEEQPVLVRHLLAPDQFLPLPALKDAALATSANFYEYEEKDPLLCAQIHGQTRKPLLAPLSVSVRAQSCLVADALTKIVFALKKGSAAVLSEFGAAAFIVYPDDKILCYDGKLLRKGKLG